MPSSTASLLICFSSLLILELPKRCRRVYVKFESKDGNSQAQFTRRSFLGGAITAFVGMKSAIKSAGRQSSSGVYEFVNGYWFDGQKFGDKRFYSVGGVLVSKKPDRRTSRIDLTGKFVIPPFGEAHNHNVEHSDRIIRAVRGGYNGGAPRPARIWECNRQRRI